MAYRVGIYDPAFRPEGHFVAFDRYIYDLLGSNDIDVQFIDKKGMMEAAYGSKAKYTQLPDAAALPGRIGKIISRYLFWRRAFKFMYQHFDFVLFTADPRDLFMCLLPLRLKYGVIVLYPYGYMARGRRSVRRGIESYIYRRFVVRAAIRFTTNEPPIRADIQNLLDVNDLHWIPDLPVRGLPEDGNVRNFDFLTIGTISKSKNHLFALDAFEGAAIPYSYCIAGKPLDATGESVRKRIAQLRNSPCHIQGDLDYLNERRYMQLMQNANFLIFPYDKVRGNISSQVLHDSFSTRTPFVAPAIEPFKWYVDKYGVGLLYKEGDAVSLTEALHKAHKLGRNAFLAGFDELARDNSLENIRKHFRSVLDPVLIKG